MTCGSTPRSAAWRDELLLLGAEDGRLLLADRVAERVGLGAGEAAERDRGGHDVLLVDEDPVRLVEVRLEQRVEVGDRLLAVLAADVGRDVVHRARAVERDHRREVVDRRRAQLADVAAHARRLELEDAGRLARCQQLEGRRVVERDRVEVDLDRRGSRGRGRPPGAGSSGSTGPRKSNLSRPSASIACISYWVISASEFVAFWSGMSSVSGSRLMTTPAACVDALRATPSSWRAKSDDPLDRRVARRPCSRELGRGLERLVEPDPELVRDRLGDPVDLAVASGRAPARRRGSRPGRASCRR